MMAAWLVYVLITGSLIALAAWAVDGVARTRAWPTRWIWISAILAMAVLIGSSLVGSIGSAREIETTRILDATTTTKASGTSLASTMAAARLTAQFLITSGVARLARALPDAPNVPWIALWLVSIAIGVMTLVFVHARLRRARRAWPSADLHGRRVRVAPTTGPAVIGFARPEIVVPRWLLGRAAVEQLMVLAHEEEHVRARDHVLLGAASLAVALMPWHPAVWWCVARLRLSIELDCDARVLRGGAAARTYGEMLIDLAGQCSGFQVGATALTDKTSHLERRLLAMKRTPTRYTLLRIGSLCAAATLALIAACEARMPTSAEIQSMDAAGAERTAVKAGLIDAMHAGGMEFYVNNVKVTAAEAHAIASKDIATVNVEKSKSATAPNFVRITTHATSVDGMKFRSASPDTGETALRARADTVRKEKMSALFDGVVIINGVRADMEELHRLDPKSIESIEVNKKPTDADLLIDPAAKNGIIKVKTKTTGKP